MNERVVWAHKSVYKTFCLIIIKYDISKKKRGGGGLNGLTVKWTKLWNIHTSLGTKILLDNPITNINNIKEQKQKLLKKQSLKQNITATIYKPKLKPTKIMFSSLYIFNCLLFFSHSFWHVICKNQFLGKLWPAPQFSNHENLKTLIVIVGKSSALALDWITHSYKLMEFLLKNYQIYVRCCNILIA